MSFGWTRLRVGKPRITYSSVYNGWACVGNGLIGFSVMSPHDAWVMWVEMTMHDPGCD